MREKQIIDIDDFNQMGDILRANVLERGFYFKKIKLEIKQLLKVASLEETEKSLYLSNMQKRINIIYSSISKDIPILEKLKNYTDMSKDEKEYFIQYLNNIEHNISPEITKIIDTKSILDFNSELIRYLENDFSKTNLFFINYRNLLMTVKEYLNLNKTKSFMVDYAQFLENHDTVIANKLITSLEILNDKNLIREVAKISIKSQKLFKKYNLLIKDLSQSIESKWAKIKRDNMDASVLTVLISLGFYFSAKITNENYDLNSLEAMNLGIKLSCILALSSILIYFFKPETDNLLNRLGISRNFSKDLVTRKSKELAENRRYLKKMFGI